MFRATVERGDHSQEEVVPGVVLENERGLPYLRYGSDRTARWWIPAEPGLRRSAAQIYKPTALGGKLRRIAMETGVMGVPVRLDEDKLGRWTSTLGAPFGLTDGRLAIYSSGTPPLTKTSALLLDGAGRVRAFAKIVGPALHRALENEHAVLSRLEDVASVRGRVPRSLGLVKLDEYVAIVTTLAPSASGPRRFGRMHRRFLLDLEHAYAVDARLADTKPVSEAKATIVSLAGRSADVWAPRLESGVQRLEDSYGDCVVRTSLAHRDFAPWNTAVGDQGLFVFDWESARWGYPVGLDYVHFLFVSDVFLERRVTHRAVDRWRSALEERYRPHERNGVFLAYLLDLASDYLRPNASSGEDGNGDDPLLERVARLLDRAGEWEES